MRIAGVSVVGVGGLQDGTVSLPKTAVAALAGTNGTGKSKLLACLLSPWLGLIPTAQGGREAQVSVHLELSDSDRQALQSFSETKSWGEVTIPPLVSINTSQHPLAGAARGSTPSLTVLTYFATEQLFLQSQPGLDVLFLPAERRLLPSGGTGIDLGQLSDSVAQQTTAQARVAVQNYGRLDDSEFEQFARALCVAEQLTDDSHDLEEAAHPRTSWGEFLETVNSLIAPKRLLPLTRRHPESLRIATPDGHQHGVQDLSSGERQALIVISRILRAGAGHSLILIDEPDAYLHLHLSRRLALALEQAVGDDGQLVLATHSPAVLDTIAPSSILRLSHAGLPKLVTGETERLEVYREAGFRASTLTQSDLLVIAEGDSDVSLLPLLIPDLARATLRAAGGRAPVLADVARLHPYDLPVLGVVDRDVLATPLDGDASNLVTIWQSADVEGVVLSDDMALEVMLERGLVKSEYTSVADLRRVLNELIEGQEENFVAEAAQRLLRVRANITWPSPKGEKAIDRLREAVEAITPPSADAVEECLQEASDLWSQHASRRWEIVRGKYVLPTFARTVSTMDSGRSLLEAVARARPPLVGVQPFARAVTESLA